MMRWMARSSRWFVRINMAVLVAASVAWPVTQLTVAREEPPFVLGLSWLAIVMTCWGNLIAAAVKDDTSGGK